MNQKKQLKVRAREARQQRQARRVVCGIVIALLLIMVLAIVAYFCL